MRAIFDKLFCKKISSQALAQALSQGLISRNGPAAFAAFQQKLQACTPDFLDAWNQGRQGDFSLLSAAVDALIRRCLDASIADADYPAFHRPPCAHFACAKLLLSLAISCAGKTGAADFLDSLALDTIPQHILTAVQARALLSQGRYRDAADTALSIKEHTVDHYVMRVLIDTQKALLRHGEKQDMDIPIVDNSKKFCAAPFTSLTYFQADREPGCESCSDEVVATTCPCLSWLPLTFDRDWNNPDICALRKSILDGSYRYCNEWNCKWLREGTLPERTSVVDTYLRDIIDNGRVVLGRPPSSLMLNYDTTCPMRCPFCPLQFIKDRTRLPDPLASVMEAEVGQLLPGVINICLSGVGEALASEHSLKIIKSITPAKFPQLKISILTSLVPVTPQLWESLGESATSIKRIFMSIDGGTQETLERLRKGLKWKRMHEALAFVKKLRQSGRLEYIDFLVTLQKDNYTELQEIFALASAYAVDYVHISPLAGWPRNPAKYREQDICSPRHPLHEDCKKAVTALKELQANMEKNRATLEAQGKSAPHLLVSGI